MDLLLDVERLSDALREGPEAPADAHTPAGAERWLRMVARGVSPRSLLAMKLLGRRGLRFRGVDISAPNLQHAWDIAMPIFSGEYDEWGFVPGRGDRVVDIGGNIGLYSMLAASRGARVTAYEPHPESFRHLERNTARWGVDGRCAAVVRDPGTRSVRLYLHPERASRHTLAGMEVGTGSVLRHAIDVPALPLSTVLDGGCDLLKMDCEGGEFELLRDPSIRKARRIIAEVHTAVGDPQPLLEDVRGAGFRALLKHGADVLHTDGQPFMLLLAARD